MQVTTLSRPTMRRWAWCWLFVAVVCPPSVLAQDPLEDEALLTAAFIYNFAKFIRWPMGTWTGPKGPLVLCTVGKDELLGSLERLGNERIGGRPVVIRRVDADAGGRECHILYISGSEHRHFARLIEQTLAAPVLTISEIRGFADSGGVIQLFRAKDRIRFKINLDVATRKRLKLSARLLDLAEVIAGETAR